MKKYRIIVFAGIGILVLFFVGMKLKNILSSGKNDNTIVAPQESFETMFKEAVLYEEQNELLKAQAVLKNIVMAYAGNSAIEKVQKKLEDINMRILLSAIQVPGQSVAYTVKKGDTLSMIADEFHTTADFIKKQNGMQTDIIRIGMPLRIWTSRFSIVVDKSQNLLMLKSAGDVIRSYRVSTGRNNITPVGNFKIVNKLVNPSWTHDGKLIPAGSPENILGTRWMGFDVTGYGIHGTTAPESIGQQATAGCVRMLNNEVDELYDLLPTGTEVTVMD